MQRGILFYVSGHGFGHARRVAEVMRSLALSRPELKLYVRTTAPEFVFSDVPGVRYSVSGLDSGAAEDDALTINPAKTLERTAELLRKADHIVANETDFVRDEAISLIVSDIPFLAGDIGVSAGMPCIALGNFTWDWIYEPFLQGFPEYEHLVSRIRESYARMQSYLRLPLAHDVDVFSQMIDTPLVARHRSREIDDRRLALPSDSRHRVMVGMRGGIEHSILAAAAAAGEDFLFIIPYRIPAGMPDNVRSIELSAELNFTDVLSACDVVISKFGYGILADCVAAQVPLLWPRRSGFREDEIMEANAVRYVKAMELPLEDFHSGLWSRHISAILNMPTPPEEMPLDGAEFCANAIAANMDAA